MACKEREVNKYKSLNFDNSNKTGQLVLGLIGHLFVCFVREIWSIIVCSFLSSYGLNWGMTVEQSGHREKSYNRGTYTKLIASYLMFILVVISILSITLYNVFYRASMEVIRENTRERLSQNINNLNLIRSRTSALGIQLLQDNGFQGALYSDSVSPEDKFLYVKKLERFILGDPTIHSIYIYNSKIKEFTRSTIESPESFDNRMMELLQELKTSAFPSRFIPSRIKYKTIRGEYAVEDIITIVFCDIARNSDELKSAVIINLKAADIQKSLLSLSSHEKSNIIVVDEKGTVIFDTLLSEFGNNISGEGFLKNIRSSDKEDDNLVGDFHGKRSLIMYRTYSVTSWMFINVTPLQSLFQSFYNLGVTIIILCIAIFVIGIILSVLAARNIYLPIDKLLNRISSVSPKAANTSEEESSLPDLQYITKSIDSMIIKTNELENSVQENIPVIKNAYLKNLISGNISYDDTFIKKFEELLGHLSIEDQGSSLNAIVFSVDEQADMEDNEKSKLHFAKYSMDSYIKDKLSGLFNCETVVMKDNLICIVVKSYEMKLENSKLVSVVSDIRNWLCSSLGIKISCSVGMPVQCIEDLHLSYGNAVEMLKYRFLLGYNTLFYYGMHELGGRPANISLDRNKEKLIQGIRMFNHEQVDTELDRIFEEISKCSYDYIMLITNQLILDIINSIREISDNSSQEMDLTNIYTNMSKIGTINEMKTFFKLYCQGQTNRLEKRKNNRKNEMINEIIKYIEDNYNNTEMSNESLAYILNLTPSYFGKLFSENIGKTVREYIIDLRISKAKELLVSTSLSIGDISLKTGFSNSTYFIQLFKKNVGVTPNQYRSENRMDAITKN